MGKESEDGVKKDDKLSSALGWFWVICVMIPAGLLGWALLRAGGMPSNVQDWGILGDFVGGISNPFISALTFLALILTILQNQKVLQLNEAELKETRREIELTREANEKQAEEFKAQNEHMHSQAEIDSLTQALLQLGEKVRREWELDERPSGLKRLDGPVNVSTYMSEDRDALLLKALEMGENSNALYRLQCISKFMPLVVGYTGLLLELSGKDQNGPMLRAGVCLMSDVLTKCLRMGYLDKELPNDDLNELQGLLSRHHKSTLLDTYNEESKFDTVFNS